VGEFLGSIAKNLLYHHSPWHRPGLFTLPCFPASLLPCFAPFPRLVPFLRLAPPFPGSDPGRRLSRSGFSHPGQSVTPSIPETLFILPETLFILRFFDYKPTGANRPAPGHDRE
jgi:hypothetical protein